MKKSSRLEVRLEPHQKDRLEQARKLGGFPSISALLLSAAEEKSREIFREKLPQLPFDQHSVHDLLHLISNPTEPNEALRQLMKTDFTNIVENILQNNTTPGSKPNDSFTGTSSKKASKERVQLR